MRLEKGQKVRVRLAGREWAEGIVRLSSDDVNTSLAILVDGDFLVPPGQIPDTLFKFSNETEQALILLKQQDGTYKDLFAHRMVWVEQIENSAMKANTRL